MYTTTKSVSKLVMQELVLLYCLFKFVAAGGLHVKQILYSRKEQDNRINTSNPRKVETRVTD